MDSSMLKLALISQIFLLLLSIIRIIIIIVFWH